MELKEIFKAFVRAEACFPVWVLGRGGEDGEDLTSCWDDAVGTGRKLREEGGCVGIRAEDYFRATNCRRIRLHSVVFRKCEDIAHVLIFPLAVFISHPVPPDSTSASAGSTLSTQHSVYILSSTPHPSPPIA